MFSQFLFTFFFGLFLFFGNVFFAHANPPSAPIISNTTHFVSACRVKLDWTQSDQADNFIKRVNGNGQGVPLDPVMACTNPSCILSKNDDYPTRVFPGSTLTYDMKALKTIGGTSGWSNQSEILTPLQVPQPSGPTELLAIWDDNGNRMNLSWNGSAGVDEFGGYRIHHSTNGTNYTAESIFPSDPAQLPYRKLGLDNHITHYYKVGAYRTGEGCDNSSISVTNDSIARFTYSSPVIIPPSPSQVSISSLTQSNGNWHATFIWSNVINESGYELQFSTFPDFNDNLAPVLITSPNTTSFVQDFADGSNITIFYRVRAYNQSGVNKGYSAYIQGISPLEIGNIVPANMSASVTYTNTVLATADVTLRWGVGAYSSKGVEIFRAVDNINNFGTNPFMTLQENIPPPSQRTINEIPGKHYFYKTRFTYGVNNHSDFSQVVEANLDIDKVLLGKAWTTTDNGAGVGWVSFNADTQDPPLGGCEAAPCTKVPHSSNIKYSVQIDRNGLVSGEAWSQIGATGHYGWLSFNKADLLGCPIAPCEARYDSSSHLLSGWARFLNPANPYYGNGSASAWDGWVSLSGSYGGSPTSALFNRAYATISSFFSKNLFSNLSHLFNQVRAEGPGVICPPVGTYGICFDANKRFVGSAWGGDLVGWIQFTDPLHNTSNEVGVTNNPPEVSNVVLQDPSEINPTESWCSADPRYRVSWTYTDPDQDPQGGAQVVLENTDNGDQINSFPVTGSVSVLDITNPLIAIGRNTAFRARVRVQDSAGAWSTANTDFGTWSASNATTTIDHYPPLFEATSTPESVPITSNTFVNFNTLVTSRMPSAPIKKYIWTFERGNPETASTASAHVRFSTFGDTNEGNKVTLTIADSYQLACRDSLLVTGKTTKRLEKRQVFLER